MRNHFGTGYPWLSLSYLCSPLDGFGVPSYPYNPNAGDLNGGTWWSPKGLPIGDPCSIENIPVRTGPNTELLNL